jgi:hypothetical protein
VKVSDLQSGFFDELAKIGVSLAGLSPETLLSQKPPEPLETPAVSKAIQILDLAKEKTAGLKEVALSGMAGGGMGGFASNFGASSPWANSWAANDPKKQMLLNNLKWYGMAAGTAIGAGRQVLKDRKAKQEQKTVTAAALSTPKMALKASKQVGVPDGKISTGPGIKSQIRGTLVGRKGQLP